MPPGHWRRPADTPPLFDGPPQALDEDVVSPGAFPIHADLDLVLEQQAGEGDAGNLGALIGVEDLGLAVSGKSLVDRFETELRFKIETVDNLKHNDIFNVAVLMHEGLIDLDRALSHWPSIGDFRAIWLGDERLSH